MHFQGNLHKTRHCFIQVIDGNTWYVRYPLETFQWSREAFSVSAGSSISIDEKDLKIERSLNYSGMESYPRSPGHPGIMGWFSFIPGLECRHDVFSMNHITTGTLQMNGKLLDFTQGTGYIEKDRG